MSLIYKPLNLTNFNLILIQDQSTLSMIYLLFTVRDSDNILFCLHFAFQIVNMRYRFSLQLNKKVMIFTDGHINVPVKVVVVELQLVFLLSFHWMMSCQDKSLGQILSQSPSRLLICPLNQNVLMLVQSAKQIKIAGATCRYRCSGISNRNLCRNVVVACKMCGLALSWNNTIPDFKFHQVCS